MCAVVPALRATRPNLSQGLQQSGRAGSSRRHRAQHAFLVTQVALTLMLLVGAGLMARSLARVWRVDPGFDPRGVVTFMTGLPDERASDPEQIRTTVRQIAERLAAVPGVQAASAVFGALPYTGNNNAVDFWRAGEPKPVGSDAPLALFSAVGPDYFRAMGIPLRQGRAFAPHDTSQQRACGDRRRGVRGQRLPWPGSDRPANPSRRDRRAGRGDRRRRSSEALGPRRGCAPRQWRAGAGVCSGRATARQPRTARRQRIQRRRAVVEHRRPKRSARCARRCASTTAARS